MDTSPFTGDSEPPWTRTGPNHRSRYSWRRDSAMRSGSSPVRSHEVAHRLEKSSPVLAIPTRSTSSSVSTRNATSAELCTRFWTRPWSMLS